MISNERYVETSASQVTPTPLVFQPGMRLRDIERVVILETLRAQNFNRTHAARVLGIGIRTLQRKLKRYGASNWGLRPSEHEAVLPKIAHAN